MLRYKERENRWIRREQQERLDLESWKNAAGLSLLELTDGSENFIRTFSLYEKIREIGYLDSWEKAFAFYDKKILEELILEDINAYYALEDEKFATLEEMLNSISPEEVFTIFIEWEMDHRPGLLPGTLILDVLDKISLLKNKR